MTTTIRPEGTSRSQDDGAVLVKSALRAAVARMDPSSAAISAYHLGWTAADGTAENSGGGKGIRPTLAILSTRAAGAPPEVGVPGAVAVELVHNFSLLHDDVMDGDTERRHRPTVWSIWGVPAAILTGDAMLTVAQEVLLNSGSTQAARATRMLLEATRELIHGQNDDLAFERRAVVEVEECQAMAARKTGALLRASASIGAILADAPEATVAALASYGDHLGAAFQLVDDLLGIWGDPAVTGKPVLSDLRSRKKSLPVTYALSSGGAPGAELAQWLSGPGAGTEGGLRRAADLIERAGGREWTGEEARRRVRLATEALDAVAIPADVQQELSALASFVVTRAY